MDQEESILTYKRAPEPVKRSPKICIAIPHMGLVTFNWARAFKQLISPVPFEIIETCNTPISFARNRLVERARKKGASHIFFLDSDVILPPDGLVRLWNHQLPVVAGIYGFKRLGGPGVWVRKPVGKFCSVNDFFKCSLEEIKNSIMSAPVDQLEKTPLFRHPHTFVGGGCILVDMAVFDRLQPPYFQFILGPNGKSFGEDIYFCVKLHEAGLEVAVDTTVRCAHIDISAAWSWDGNMSLFSFDSDGEDFKLDLGR